MKPVYVENVNPYNYRFNHPVIAAVIAQLEKDIMLSGGEFQVSREGYMDIEKLKAEMHDFISLISVRNPSLLINLMYRVDIPQKLINDTQEDLSMLLLKRELVKVLMRISYESK